MHRTAEDWERFLGEQLKSIRIQREMTQLEAAERLGISVGTVSRIENGSGSSLETLIRLIQLYGKEQWLESIAPQATISPIQQFQLGHQRQRVRERKEQRA